jgi:hypothetical protein
MGVRTRGLDIKAGAQRNSADKAPQAEREKKAAIRPVEIFDIYMSATGLTVSPN